MKSGRLILSVGIIGCVLFLQGWFAAQVLGEEKPASAPVTGSAAAGQQTPAQPPATPEPNGPPPKISFEQPIHDFGAIAPGSTGTCEFKFQNKGAGTLAISDITKTCGCTVPELAKKQYAPAEEGVVKVTYNADRSPGIRTRNLYVLSNDPCNPRVELTVRAVIVQKVVFEPEQLDYKLKGDKAGVAELTIHSSDEQPFTITKFEATAEAVTANFDPNQKAAKFVLQTKIDSQKMGTNGSGRIEITLTHPECTSLAVPFSILSRFRADPLTINVLDAEPGKAVQKELWVLNNYDEDFEIASATSKEGVIKVVSQEKLGNRYKFNLEITPPPAKNTARMFTDTLSISTKDGEKIDVICRGFYRRK
jgi:hypothetical protein